jgi:hypothetical protein
VRWSEYIDRRHAVWDGIEPLKIWAARATLKRCNKNSDQEGECGTPNQHCHCPYVLPRFSEAARTERQRPTCCLPWWYL